MKIFIYGNERELSGKRDEMVKKNRIKVTFLCDEDSLRYVKSIDSVFCDERSKTIQVTQVS